YVSPTRGARGNALKTVLAIPFVLNSGCASTVCIEACGVRHIITVSTNHVLRRPHIEHRQEEIVKTEGTSIQICRNSASSKPHNAESGFLQNLLFDYSLFNPHATFVVRQKEAEHIFQATTGDWRKWTPADPTSAHWYNLERFEDLVASYIA